MYIAMNRFRIARGREGDFEKLWRERESHLDGVPGFGLAQQRGKALAADQLGIHHAGVTLLCHGSFHVPFMLPAVSDDSRRPQQAPIITS